MLCKRSIRRGEIRGRWSGILTNKIARQTKTKNIGDHIISYCFGFDTSYWCCLVCWPNLDMYKKTRDLLRYWP